MEEKNYYVYILSSISKVLYVGFTDCLVKRIYQHKKGDYYKAETYGSPEITMYWLPIES